MAAGAGSSIDTIYVELLGEGTFVLRPTRGVKLGELRYKILPTDDYNPDLETWQHPPGSVVDCQWENHRDGKLLVARTRLA